MNWFSFALGFLAFPLFAALSYVIFLCARRLVARRAALAELTLAGRGATLSFSSRLIGEIGGQLDTEPGPTAKAS